MKYYTFALPNTNYYFNTMRKKHYSLRFYSHLSVALLNQKQERFKKFSKAKEDLCVLYGRRIVEKSL